MPSKPAQYQVGDRVAERPVVKMQVWNGKPVDSKFSQWRVGTVVAIKTKLNKRKAKENYLMIQWDCLGTPSEHAQFRICHLDKLEELRKGAINAVG